MRVALGGVPETLLWTLYQRAAEARRTDAVLRDPWAVGLADSIDFPYAERFGPPRLAQWQALRAACFDHEVRRFLARRPGGRVVALGEGLETQYWRVDDGRVRWLTVDVPDAVELRQALLPRSERQELLAGSAFDQAWLERVDPEAEVLVTAQGLLMYFEPDAVHGLLARCLAALPRATLVFDAFPHWLALLNANADPSGGYRPPPWHWSLDRREERRLRAHGRLRRLRLPRGRGPAFGLGLPLMERVPLIDDWRYSVFRLQAR